MKQEYVAEFWVSTVFLGLDHSYGKGPPILWETMVFGGSMRDEYMERYTSEQEALEGHERAKQWAKEHSRWYRRMWGHWWHDIGTRISRRITLWRMQRFLRKYGSVEKRNKD